MSKRRSHAQAASGRRPPSRGRRKREPHTMEDTVRMCASWVVDRALSTLAPSSVYLDSAIDRLHERDHALLRELALGTLRWLRRLDQVIQDASDRSIDAIDPALRGPLRIGAYQLLFLDRIPAHAAVHEAVDHARRATHKGGASFTNAVLRRIARAGDLTAWPVREKDPVRRLAIEKSHPDFLVRRWLSQFGEPRTQALLDANNRPKALQLLAFPDRGGRELLAETLIDEEIEVEPSRLVANGLVVRRGNPLRGAAYARGDFYIQDQASQAAAIVPPPRAGERILDAAAAPGGKTFAMLARESTISPVLADISPERVATLRSNVGRLGRELPVLVADAGKSPLSASFDRVVLDLPCTGTGTLRKHPELKWRISDGEIGRLSRQAGRLLAGAAPRVAVGGLLVAITCSLEPDENEAVVDAFLRRHPAFEAAPLDGRLDYPLEDYVIGPGAWRMLPAADHDGHTVHVLRRAREEDVPSGS